MRFKAKITALVLAVSFLFFFCDSEERIPMFKNTEKVSISNPYDEATGIKADTEFSFNTNENAKHYVLAIFTEPIKINDNNIILNWDKCAGGMKINNNSSKIYRTNFSSMKTFDMDSKKFTDKQLALGEGKYYWGIWGLDKYGNLHFSSYMYSFTVISGVQIIVY